MWIEYWRFALEKGHKKNSPVGMLRQGRGVCMHAKWRSI